MWPSRKTVTPDWKVRWTHCKDSLRLVAEDHSLELKEAQSSNPIQSWVPLLHGVKCKMQKCSWTCQTNFPTVFSELAEKFRHNIWHDREKTERMFDYKCDGMTVRDTKQHHVPHWGLYQWVLFMKERKAAVSLKDNIQIVSDNQGTSEAGTMQSCCGS